MAYDIDPAGANRLFHKFRQRQRQNTIAYRPRLQNHPSPALLRRNREFFQQLVYDIASSAHISFT
jgi:hypothetical protein